MCVCLCVCVCVCVCVCDGILLGCEENEVKEFAGKWVDLGYTILCEATISDTPHALVLVVDNLHEIY